MLTAAKNDMLTRVGPGTPMGNLLRRYWMPIAGASELTAGTADQAAAAAGRGPRALQGPRRPLRPHRAPLRASRRRSFLRHGRGERPALLLPRLEVRCARRLHRAALRGHRQRPIRNRREGCAIAAYPVRELAGLLWAYMGPQPAPELPVWEPFTYANGFREIVTARRALQLVPVPGELHRPGAFRMDARELERARCAGRRRAPRAISSSLRRVRARLRLSPHPRGRRRAGRQLVGRPRGAVAERLLSRHAFRMARAGRRREHAQHRLVLHARAQGARALCAGKRAGLGKAGARRATAISSSATSSTRTSSAGWGRAASPTAHARTCAPAISASSKCASASSPISRRWRRARTRPASSAMPPPRDASRCPTSCADTMSRACRSPITPSTRCCKERLAGFRHHYGQPPEVRRAFEQAMGISG